MLSWSTKLIKDFSSQILTRYSMRLRYPPVWFFFHVTWKFVRMLSLKLSAASSSSVQNSDWPLHNCQTGPEFLCFSFSLQLSSNLPAGQGSQTDWHICHPPPLPCCGNLHFHPLRLCIGSMTYFHQHVRIPPFQAKGGTMPLLLLAVTKACVFWHTGMQVTLRYWVPKSTCD